MYHSKSGSIRRVFSRWSQFDVDLEQLPLNQGQNTVSGFTDSPAKFIAFLLQDWTADADSCARTNPITRRDRGSNEDFSFRRPGVAFGVAKLLPLFSQFDLNNAKSETMKIDKNFNKIAYLLVF